MKKIIINADDFGMNDYVNNAIIAGHTNGIITSTSLVASGDKFIDAIKMANDHPNLGIGVHITLVGGLKPLSKVNEVSSLVNENGVFFDSHTEFIKKVYTKQINFNEVYNELDLQFKRILSTNLPITHIDGHQHLHVLPEVLPIVFALMKKYNIRKLRIPKEFYTFFNSNYSIGRIIGKCGLSFLSERARHKAKSLHFASPRYFWGMMNGGNMTEDNLLAIINKAKNYTGSHEIMIHPGTSNKELNKLYNWNYNWEQELEAVLSNKVKNLLSDNKFKLVNYGDIT